MGQAIVLSHLGDAKYRIRILRDFARAQAELAAIDEQVLKIDETITKLEEAISGIDAAMVPLFANLEYLIGLEAAQPGIDKDIEKQITEVFKQITQKKKEKDKKTIELDIQKILKASKQKKKTQIENALATKQNIEMDAWCVDYVTDIANGTLVGTLETDDDTMVFTPSTNIKPGGQMMTASETHATYIQPTISSGYSAVFYNLALLPGVQKWKPRYRKATIKHIIGAACEIELDDTFSSRHPKGLNLSINKKLTYTGVPFQYLDCDANAFQVDDRVIVDFQGNPDTPKVIGFVDHPRQCPITGPIYRYLHRKTLSAGISGKGYFGSTNIDWGTAINCGTAWPAISPVDPNYGSTIPLFAFNGSWYIDPPEVAESPTASASISFTTAGYSVRYYQISSLDGDQVNAIWRVRVPWIKGLYSSAIAQIWEIKQQWNGSGWTTIDQYVISGDSVIISGSFNLIGISEDALTPGTQTSEYYELVGGTFAFNSNSGEASGDFYLYSKARCALEASIDPEFTALYEYHDPDISLIPNWTPGLNVVVGTLRKIPAGTPDIGSFKALDKIRSTAVRTTSGGLNEAELANWELFNPTTNDWSANSSVSTGDFRRATANVGGFVIGQVIKSSATRTTRDSFDFTESGYWAADRPAIVTAATMSFSIQNFSYTII